MKAVKCGALDWSSLGKLLILPWWCLTFQAASSSFKHVETLTLTMLIQGTCLISAWRIKNVTQTYEYQIQHAKSTKRIKHASVKYCTSRLPASFWFIDGYRRLSTVIACYRRYLIGCLNIQNTSELSRPRHLVLFLGKKPKEPWRGRSNLRWDMVHLHGQDGQVNPRTSRTRGGERHFMTRLK